MLFLSVFQLPDVFLYDTIAKLNVAVLHCRERKAIHPFVAPEPKSLSTPSLVVTLKTAKFAKKKTK